MDKQETTPTEKWLLLKGEEYEEKLLLANNAIMLFRSLSWYEKIFRSKKLFDKYIHELRTTDIKYKTKEKNLRKEIDDMTKEIVSQYKARRPHEK